MGLRVVCGMSQAARIVCHGPWGRGTAWRNSGVECGIWGGAASSAPSTMGRSPTPDVSRDGTFADPRGDATSLENDTEARVQSELEHAHVELAIDVAGLTRLAGAAE